MSEEHIIALIVDGGLKAGLLADQLCGRHGLQQLCVIVVLEEDAGQSRCIVRRDLAEASEGRLTSAPLSA